MGLIPDKTPTKRGKRGGHKQRRPGVGSFPFAIALANFRSVVNKSAAVTEFIEDNALDFLAITESWLSPETGDADLFALLASRRFTTLVGGRRVVVWVYCSGALFQSLAAHPSEPSTYLSFWMCVLQLKRSPSV